MRSPEIVKDSCLESLFKDASKISGVNRGMESISDVL